MPAYRIDASGNLVRLAEPEQDGLYARSLHPDEAIARSGPAVSVAEGKGWEDAAPPARHAGVSN